MPRNFAHVHLHTEYSVLDGGCRIGDALDTAASMGMDSLAITDHGVMYGAVSFYRKAMERGIKPVLGSEVYIATGGRLLKEGGLKEQPCHLVLLAADNTGYQNLMRIVSRGFTEGFYYRPRVDLEVLRDHREGIIALSACLKGEIPKLLLAGDAEGARKAAEEYAGIFGEGNFYIEIMDHGIPEQASVNSPLVDLAREMGLGLVVTNDVHYIKREDSKAHDHLLCIQTGSLVADESRLRFSSDEFYMKSAEEMAALFPDYPEALDNTVEIASRCDVEIELDKVYLPNYNPPEGYDLDSYLEHLAREGMRNRFGDDPPPEVALRLEAELDVIRKLGFSGYFLIVWDFIEYARKQGIRVGPGRGSAAGSLVAYAIGITAIDPMKYGLLFERFLNPERIALPDIDIDFSHFRRQEVIDYVAQKYGRDRVAQIITFSRLNARQAVKDVGRVMDIPFQRMDAITKMVPERPDMTIDLALQQSNDLKLAYEDDPEVREVIDTARTLEGLVRHHSKHAAGVVIADDELIKYTPLKIDEKEGADVMTQFDMYDIERLGLLKVDFLGLKNQSLLELAVNSINARHDIDLDIDAIPMDDPETFKLIQSGRTVGTFQLASPGMRALMREMMPNKFEDIIALIALYRPGPLESNMHKAFVDQKHGRRTVRYPHHSLEEILRETYGVIVYQEQVMSIARELAGYTGLEADELRKAMAKKKPEIMLEHREKFMSGSLARGIEEGTARGIFDLIEKFGGYGFNKSHSTVYAFVSYQTAYLKAHYPSEYMAALMTIYMNDQDRLVEYINETRRIGISVRPPDINLSDSDFTPFDDHVLFGLSAVRNVGTAAVDQIIEFRNEGGPFKSLLDFCGRVPGSVTNKKTIESLIKAGAFDSIEQDRNLLLGTYESAVSTAQRRRREKEEGQFSLFGQEDEMEEALNGTVAGVRTAYTKKQLLIFEKSMLGAYVSDHPLSDRRDQLYRHSDIEVSQVTDEMDKTVLALGGMLTRLEKRYNKAGKPWASFALEDFTGSIEVLVFSNKYEKIEEFLEDDAIVLVKGRVDMRENKRKLLADEVSPLPTGNERPGFIEIRIEASRFSEELIGHIREVLLEHPGEVPVHLRVRENGVDATKIKLGEFYSVEPESDLLAKLKSMLGESSVVIAYEGQSPSR